MAPMLQAVGVSKYYGGLKAVDTVDMVVEKGDIFGIIGPNGAGKTTFFNVCSGIEKPNKGKIFLNEEDITNCAPEQIAKKGMARTFQNIKLFRYMSVLENVKIGFHIQLKTSYIDAIFHTRRFKDDEEYANRKGREIISLIGLNEYENTMAGSLPYGIQRRVEIARALALHPSILLLDEPAAGMNPSETLSLMKCIKELNESGYTIVVIEHDMKFVMNLCDKILVLNFGRKICEGVPEIVKNDPAVCEAYFGKSLAARGDLS